MCGIFGVLTSQKCELTFSELKHLFEQLFLLSESRGKESSGFAIRGEKEIKLLKSPVSASEFIRSASYNEIFKDLESHKNTVFQAIGHSRLVTNGRGALNRNNQPVVKCGDVMVHNGIIVNDDEIWRSINQTAETELDTEALIALFVDNVKRLYSREISLQHTFSKISGNASVCILNNNDDDVLLATDNGSIYYIDDKEMGVVVFASEKFILQQLIKRSCLKGGILIKHLKARDAISINPFNLKITNFRLTKDEDVSSNLSSDSDALPSQTERKIIDYSSLDYPDYKNIRRCVKCILPESFPGLVFDLKGVCNKCRDHKTIELNSISDLKDNLRRYRNKDGSPDCIVGLSGGRDSCYGLHIIKEELGFNPIAYTYDWGLVTDLARRNISRMCGQLGVEHILISADIHKKRQNVRKNIQAWLKKPDLSMIPLFMAGDKQFYYHAHQLRKQTGIDLFLFAAGNELERTDFKIAFSGLSGDSGKGVLTQLSAFNKLKLMLSYGKKFISNPSYLNSSLFDSFHAFYSSYFLEDDYFYLYHYYPWDEKTINNTLVDQYGWEVCPDTTTTWRIGDGTAAFYNYIYYVVAGFTEHDTFRSNQVREGVITRDEALKLVAQDNKPRWESLSWYANTVGFSLDEALLAVHRMRKLY